MCICQKYENWLAVDNVITEGSRLTFLVHPVWQVFNSCVMLSCARFFSCTRIKLVAPNRTQLYAMQETCASFLKQQVSGTSFFEHVSQILG